MPVKLRLRPTGKRQASVCGDLRQLPSPQLPTPKRIPAGALGERRGDLPVTVGLHPMRSNRVLSTPARTERAPGTPAWELGVAELGIDTFPAPLRAKSPHL